MRIVGALVLIVAIGLAALGALWLVFALIGTEWDYCPSGNDCIAGELMGLALIAVAGALLAIALRLIRAR